MTTIENNNKVFIEIEEEQEDNNEKTEYGLENQFAKLALIDGLEEEEYIDTEPLFTRYLYIINDVYVSLFDSIVKGKKQEAIFWAFELYYSGFEQEVWLFLISFYREHFEKYNSQKIKKFIEANYEEWFENTNKHYILAIVASNMCVFNFVYDYNLQRNLTRNKIVYCIYQAEDVKKYETKVVSLELKHYRVLRLTCEYSTVKMGTFTGKILEKYLQPKYTREQLINIFRYHWEYYCYNTPVWKERIQKNQGVLDHKSKKVLFEEDVFQDIFYDNYGYEPDEQPLAVLHYCVGESF